MPKQVKKNPTEVVETIATTAAPVVVEKAVKAPKAKKEPKVEVKVEPVVVEEAAAANAPKYMEWYAAFGLMVSLVWLYLEILRLLGNLSRRR